MSTNGRSVVIDENRTIDAPTFKGEKPFANRREIKVGEAIPRVIGILLAFTKEEREIVNDTVNKIIDVSKEKVGSFGL